MALARIHHLALLLLAIHLNSAASQGKTHPSSSIFQVHPVLYLIELLPFFGYITQTYMQILLIYISYAILTYMYDFRNCQFGSSRDPIYIYMGMSNIRSSSQIFDLIPTHAAIARVRWNPFDSRALFDRAGFLRALYCRYYPKCDTPLEGVCL